MNPLLPPSFDENATVFGLALFGLLLSAAISLAMIIHIFRDTKLGYRSFDTPYGHFQMGKILLFFAMLLASFGDLLVMLSWNEVTENSKIAFYMFDRILDFLTVIPILLSVVLFFRGSPEMKIHLDRPPLPFTLYVQWEVIKNQVRIGVVAAILAAVVAYGKASS